MNETDTTPFPYDRISPELGKFMNVRFRWKADTQYNYTKVSQMNS